MTFTGKERTTFIWLVPSNESDRGIYNIYEKSVMETLEAAYGYGFYSKDIHRRRLLTERQHLCIVLSVCASVIACSYIREDGKRSASAVQPAYRGMGLGDAMVKESLLRIPRQFAEISIKNISHINRLQRYGFHQVDEIETLQKLLDTLWPLVVNIQSFQGRLIYERRSRDNSGLSHQFQMLSNH